MYFLVIASSPKRFDLATSNFAGQRSHDVESNMQPFMNIDLKVKVM